MQLKPPNNHVQIILLLCFTLQYLNALDNSVRTREIQTTGIVIALTDVDVINELTARVKGWVECGVHFLITKNKENYLNGIAFHLDEENQKCEIGIVSFPVDEIEEGGISVFGISK